MSQAALEKFFSTWSMSDAGARLAVFDDILAGEFIYADPHCPAPVTGAEGAEAMASQFSASMPGAGAEVQEKVSEHNGFGLYKVRFHKDGQTMVVGSYFAQADGDRLKTVVGFVGG